jgi:hypothetical protein
MLDDLSLNTGIARVGNSGTLDIRSGSSASGSGGSSAISSGSGTDIEVAFSVAAGNLLGAAGGDGSMVSGSLCTSTCSTQTLGPWAKAPHHIASYDWLIWKQRLPLLG